MIRQGDHAPPPTDGEGEKEKEVGEKGDGPHDETGNQGGALTCTVRHVLNIVIYYES